jgi:hypothetical protein
MKLEGFKFKIMLFTKHDDLSLTCAVLETFRHKQRLSYNTVSINRIYQDLSASQHSAGQF